MNINEDQRLINADSIAEMAHENTFRKWSEEKALYIEHPRRVANKLKFVEDTNIIDYCAALLHDVLEDVAIPNNQIGYYEELIISQCGEEVLDLVWELTNPSAFPEYDDKPREEKRKADWEHIKDVSKRAKQIKIIDRLDNLKDYKLMPKKLLQKYIPESRILLTLIKDGNESLAKELDDFISIIEVFLDDYTCRENR